MKPAEYLAKAKEFLNQAEIGYINGDDECEFCPMFWQAASHAVQAVAQNRGWDCADFSEQQRAVWRLSEEIDDHQFRHGFSVAENMYWHSQIGFVRPFDDYDVAVVRYFINRMAALALAPPTPISNIQEVAG